MVDWTGDSEQWTGQGTVDSGQLAVDCTGDSGLNRGQGTVDRG